MHGGKIWESGPTSELFARPQTRRIQAVLFERAVAAMKMMSNLIPKIFAVFMSALGQTRC
jgi:hypothetical protein